MNFYIGNQLSDISDNGYNVWFDINLHDFICRQRKYIPFNIDAIGDIDPYADVIIKKEIVSEIIEVCELLLECEYLHEYEDYDEAIEILKETIKIAKEAQALNVGLVSSGD